MDCIEATHYHKNPLVRYFFRRKWNIAIEMAELNKGDIILDFGCGEGYLKKVLKEHKVTGYDITPEHSDLKDYKEIKPTKIFVLDVFEHIPLIVAFKENYGSFRLITIIPTENFISRKLRRLVGKPEITEGHITKLKDIIDLLNKNLTLEKSKSFWTISYIASYIKE